MISTRWSTPGDRFVMLAIDRLSHRPGWTDEDLRLAVSAEHHHGMIAEIGDATAGFAVYRLEPRRIAIVRLAVHPGYRREGVGTAMVRALAGKLSDGRRTRLAMVVPDHDVGAHLFLASCGFQAIDVARGEFGDDDGYRFLLTHAVAAAVGV